ncbi:MAG: trehalose-phosphatase [Chitinispirillales bacterium]|jgi:trehalose-phosphatase|nr:trehalose-phosphatase [Chitinispirillales bacterium]
MNRRNLARISAVVLDLDGVLTSTAKLHAAAWKKVFDFFLQRYSRQTGTPFIPLDEARDYREFIDGRPRYEGVERFLESRGIALPYGTPDDPPDMESICGLGNLKNSVFLSLLRGLKAAVYDDSLQMVKLWKRAGFRLGVVSASKNAREVLKSVDLQKFFDVIVDGNDALLNGLKGKPRPDTFLFAAKLLGAQAEESVVIEDAFAGVKAGSLGGFALVTGVSRDGRPKEEFIKNGADIVVSSLNQIPPVGALLKREVRALPSAIDYFDKILKSLDGKNSLICLDYDGTLTPIVERPQDARLGERMREVLSGLSSLVKAAVISGRGLEDLRSLVNLDNIIYCGSHGFQIAGPNSLRMELDGAAASRGALLQTGKTLRELLGAIDGVIIETKKFGLSVHYRLVKEELIEKVKNSVAEAASVYPELKITYGKKVIDLRPGLTWDKGKAVSWIAGTLFNDKNEVHPIYIGDDITDEDAFCELHGWGTAILVGNHGEATFANYSLQSPNQVQSFLEKLTSHFKIFG